MNREQIRSLVVKAITDSNTLTSVVDKLSFQFGKIEELKEKIPLKNECKTVVEAFMVQELDGITNPCVCEKSIAMFQDVDCKNCGRLLS